MSRTAWFFVALSLACAACGSGRTPPPAKSYELSGQVLDITPERHEVLIRHGEIPGLMPAMTMTYRVQDDALLKGKQPGDLVTATLVVGEIDAHLSTLTKTGHAPIQSPPTASLAGQILDPGQTVPDAQLVDQDGTPRRFSSFRGHRVAVTFAYTRCPLPDFCPLMNRNFAAVQAQVEKTPSLSDVTLLTVTVDPAYDTPAVLKAHAKLYKADPDRWLFLTGKLDEVKRFAAAFGISMEADPDTPGQIIHNLRTAVVDANGRLVKATSGNDWKPADLVAELEATPAPAH
jgi:protein SCO1/2